MNGARGGTQGGGRGGRRQDLAGRIDRLTELPMILLAVVYIVAFAVGFVPDIPPGGRRAAELAEYFVVALFAAELVVKVAVAERRLAYLRAHWLDVLIVFVPFFRPLRVLRVLRLVPFVARVLVGLRRIMGPYRGAYVVIVALLAVLVSAALMTAFERDAGGSIADFGDALWWAAATITTVGYGDVSPVTPAGRAVAVFLMVVGIALFGLLTAGVAAYFIEGAGGDEQGVTTRDLMLKLEALEARLEAQDRILRSLQHGGAEAAARTPPQSPSPRGGGAGSASG